MRFQDKESQSHKNDANNPSYLMIVLVYNNWSRWIKASPK